LANDILPVGYEGRVRMRLGLNSTDTITLPDADIQDLALEAETIIESKCPGWTAYKLSGGTSWELIQSAAIFQLAAMMCPSMSQRIKLQESDETGYSYRLQEIDWEKKEIELSKKAGANLFLATGEPAMSYSPLGVVSNVPTEI